MGICGLEEAVEIIKTIDALDDYELQEAIETIFKELEHLQRENEELKKGNEVIDRFPLVRTVKR